MSEPLSLELRTRVLAAIAHGASHREAASCFGVCAASANRCRLLVHEQGGARPALGWGEAQADLILEAPNDLAV